MQQEAFVQGINVPDPPGAGWAFNPWIVFLIFKIFLHFVFARIFAAVAHIRGEFVLLFLGVTTQRPNYAQRTNFVLARRIQI